jgi:autotransporter-associated beta strand protein
VSNGAVFDVTAAGLIELGTNQALGGAGTVLGGVIAQPGARLLPGLDAIGTLSLAGNVGLHAASTNVFQLGGVTNEGGAFNDLVAVTGDLEPSNSVLRIDPIAPLANGVYRLLTYTGAKGTTFNPTPVASLGRKGAYVDETVPGQVNLVVTGAYGALVWLPQANALWNTTDNNWSNTVAAALDLYGSLDEVQFDEAGAYSNLVTIPAAVTPSRVTAAGASNYTFAGGAIAGVGSLVKTGGGTLTVLNTNTFSGPTTIEGGVLHLGDGGGDQRAVRHGLYQRDQYGRAVDVRGQRSDGGAGHPRRRYVADARPRRQRPGRILADQRQFALHGHDHLHQLPVHRQQPARCRLRGGDRGAGSRPILDERGHQQTGWSSSPAWVGRRGRGSWARSGCRRPPTTVP